MGTIITIINLVTEIVRAWVAVVVTSVGGDLRGPEVHHLRLHVSAFMHHHVVPSQIVHHG